MPEKRPKVYPTDVYVQQIGRVESRQESDMAVAIYQFFQKEDTPKKAGADTPVGEED